MHTSCALHSTRGRGRPAHRLWNCLAHAAFLTHAAFHATNANYPRLDTVATAPAQHLAVTCHTCLTSLTHGAHYATFSALPALLPPSHSSGIRGHNTRIPHRWFRDSLPFFTTRVWTRFLPFTLVVHLPFRHQPPAYPNYRCPFAFSVDRVAHGSSFVMPSRTVQRCGLRTTPFTRAGHAGPPHRADRTRRCPWLRHRLPFGSRDVRISGHPDSHCLRPFPYLDTVPRLRFTRGTRRCRTDTTDLAYLPLQILTDTALPHTAFGSLPGHTTSLHSSLLGVATPYSLPARRARYTPWTHRHSACLTARTHPFFAPFIGSHFLVPCPQFSYTGHLPLRRRLSRLLRFAVWSTRMDTSVGFCPTHTTPVPQTRCATLTRILLSRAQRTRTDTFFHPRTTPIFLRL